MSQEPTPRGPLGQLLDDAKDASDKEWREIEARSGIPLTTIQSWTSGRVAEPPLRGFLHLAKTLGIPPDELVDRALDGYVPPLEAKASAAQEAARDAGSVEAVGDAIGARPVGRAAREPQKRHRRS